MEHSQARNQAKAKVKHKDATTHRFILSFFHIGGALIDTGIVLHGPVQRTLASRFIPCRQRGEG